jgi:hypothetical protein
MAFTHGIRRHRLQRVPFAANGSPPIDLSTLPPGHRIHGFELHLPATITTTAAAALYTGDKLVRLMNKVRIGKRAEGSGRFWDVLDWLMYGKHANLAADMPATNSTAFRRDIRWFINYADPHGYMPIDHAVRTEMLKNQPLEITFGDVASIFPQFASVTGNLRPYAIIEPAPARKLGSPVFMGHEEVTGLQKTLMRKGIAYTHMFLFKEDLSAFTDAEVPGVTLRVDGETLYDDLSVAELVTMFMRQQGHGAMLESLSATVQSAGEAIDNQPSRTGGANSYSFPFIPLYVPDPRNQATRAMRVRQGVEVNIASTGTLTGCRIGFRALEMQSANQVVRAAAKAGIAANGYRPSTDDGVGMQDQEGGSLLGKHV